MNIKVMYKICTFQIHAIYKPLVTFFGEVTQTMVYDLDTPNTLLMKKRDLIEEGILG